MMLKKIFLGCLQFFEFYFEDFFYDYAIDCLQRKTVIAE